MDTSPLAIDTNLTIYTAQEMKARLCQAVQENASLELDLSGVGEMDTAGFQLLIMAKREAQRLGHRLAIVAHSPQVREVIDFYDMAAYFGDPIVIPAADGR